MGDLSISCGVSSISMMEEKAVLFPLLPNDYDAMKDGKFVFKDGANIINNDGSRGLFTPFTLPIFGHLDSYGKLVNIEKNSNTKAIEDYYEIGIDVFAKIISRGDLSGSYDKFKVKHTAGMFVHRKIYDFMLNQDINDSGQGVTSIWDNDSGHISLPILNLLGFKYVSTDANHEKYKDLFINSEIPQVKVWSDGTWGEV